MKKIVMVIAMTATFSTGLMAGEGHGHDSEKQQMDMSKMKGMNHGKMDMSHMKGMDHSKMNMGHDEEEAHGEEGMMSGASGHANDVSQVIAIEATDAMRFKNKPFSVKAGETVKFVVKNSGKMRHEFVIGTKEENADHRKEMMAMMKSGKMMMHADANAISLAPGETKSLIWKFSDRQDIEADCNVPGHYEGGMYTAIPVK